MALANHRPTSKERNHLRKTRYGAIHEHNPAGSKFARRTAKNILRRTRQIARLSGRLQDCDTPVPVSKKISHSRALVIIKGLDMHFQQGKNA